MAFCKKCGNQVNDQAKFCNKCGNPHEVKQDMPKENLVAKSEPVVKDQYAGYFTWSVMSNELVRRISLTEVEGYEKAKGMYVMPGILISLPHQLQELQRNWVRA